MAMIIKNGRVLIGGELVARDIEIAEGKIQRIAPQIDAAAKNTVDARGNFVSAGFIDVHVHLREPGAESKETIATGTAAAARGGFTTVCAMPNTNPVPDSVQRLAHLQRLIAEHARVRVLPYAAISKNQAGVEAVDFEALAAAGVFQFSDDGIGVQSAAVMYEAMLAAQRAGKAVVAHCEDKSLTYGGAMHQGQRSAELNIPGIPSVCESVQIARDVLLAEATGCQYHVCHISTKEGVRIIRDAKKAGIKVTAEVTPHHLLLTDADVPADNALYKMNPPLRSAADRDALIAGLLDGTIDCIATDHAPHLREEKSLPMRLAPFGIVGSEIAFQLLYTRLVRGGTLTLQQLVDFFTVKPANIFGLPYGRLEEGAPADLTIIDLDTAKEILAKDFASKSANTPFLGETVYGHPVCTIYNGQIVFEYGKDEDIKDV